jgi:16S rRNA processing protein RimM
VGSKRESGSSSRSSTEPLRLGRVGRPHGTNGAFHIDDPTARLNLLDPGRTVGVGGERREVEWRGGTAAKPLMRLAGVVDRDGAAALRGQALEVSRAEFGALEPGEHLARDLVGFVVTDGDRPVGLVRDVLILPSVDCLEVERTATEAGTEPLLVPLVGDAVRSLDVDTRRVDVDLAFLEPRQE